MGCSSGKSLKVTLVFNINFGERGRSPVENLGSSRKSNLRPSSNLLLPTQSQAFESSFLISKNGLFHFFVREFGSSRLEPSIHLLHCSNCTTSKQLSYESHRMQVVEVKTWYFTGMHCVLVPSRSVSLCKNDITGC